MKRAFWIIAALACTAPTAARAGEPSTADAASTDRGKQAQASADAAYQAYQSGDYPRAIALYSESYKSLPTADTLFNIASIYDKKIGDSRLAVEFYRRYNASPDASPELVARATTRIAALGAQADAQSAAHAQAAAAPKPAPASEGESSSGSGWRVAGLVTGGVGLVGLGVGTAFGLSAKSKHSDATDAGCASNACPDAASAATERDASKAATVSTIAFVAGGALLAGGIAMILLAPSREEKRDDKSAAVSAVRVAPAVGPGSVGLTLAGNLF